MKLQTTDVELGTVSDLLVEDDRWNVRYLVVRLNSPRRHRQILISTAALSDVDLGILTITTGLNSQQVFSSPPVNFDKPISRRYEQALVDYYGWPIYWLGRLIRRTPREMYLGSDDVIGAAVNEEDSANLRSVNEICGYQLRSPNHAHGYLEDLVINLQSWMAVHAIVNPVASCPIMQPYAIVPCSSFRDVDWARQQIKVHGTSSLDQTAVRGTSCYDQQEIATHSAFA